MHYHPFLKSETHFIPRILDKEQWAYRRSEISELKSNVSMLAGKGKQTQDLLMFYRKCLEQIWSLANCFKPLTVKWTDLTGARFQFCLHHLLAGWAEAKPFHLSLGLLDIKTGRAPTTKTFVGCCRAGTHTRWRDAALAPRPSVLVERITDHWRQLRMKAFLQPHKSNTSGSTRPSLLLRSGNSLGSTLMLTDRLAEFITRESQRSHGVRVTEGTEALRLVLGLCLHSKPRAFTYILCLPGEWKFWNGLKQSPGSLWETPVSTHLTAWMPLAMPISWWPKGMWTHVLRCNRGIPHFTVLQIL